MSVSKLPEPWRDRYQHAVAWERDYPPLSLVELFTTSAEAWPDRPVTEFLGRTTSYRRMLDEARHFATSLKLLGIAPGDRVGLFLPNVPAYVPAYYGAMMAGAAVVNFSPLYTARELEAQVADSGTRLIVTLDSAALLPKALEVLAGSALERLVVARLADQLPLVKSLALRLLGRKQLTPIPDAPDVTAWEALPTGGMPPKRVIDPLTELALLQYTGGTTGTPKGAMLTHQNLSANARQLRDIDPDRGERDVTLGVLPLFHVFANSCILNRTVLNGGMIAMLPRFEAAQVLATIRRVRPTAMFVVPTMLQALLDDPRMGGTEFSSLREIISGGAPLALPIKERFEAVSGARVVEGYGLTEAAGVIATNPLREGDRDGTIGQPLPATRIRLLDKDDSVRDAAPGEPGELAVQGPQVMRGYWNRADVAEAAFARREDGMWLRTGDIAQFDADGFLTIVDRSKDMISVGGFKVFPSQVEAVLAQHPAVKEAAVIGVADTYRGEVPRAFVTLLHPGLHPATREELRDWLNDRVGKHERVDSVVVRESLPKTMIGKLDRKALKAELGT